MQTTVEDLAQEVTSEAILARDIARLRGAADAVVGSAAETLEAIQQLPSAARGGVRSAAAAIGVDDAVIGSILARSIAEEARLTGRNPAELAARDRAAQARIEAGAAQLLTAAQAAWEDPAAAALAGKDAALTELRRLLTGPAAREAEAQALLAELRRGDIAYGAYLDGVRGLAREATEDLAAIAGLAVPVAGGGAAVIRRIGDLDLDDWGGGGASPAFAAGSPRPQAPHGGGDPTAQHAAPMVWDAERGAYATRNHPRVVEAIEAANDQKHAEALARVPKKNGPKFDQWLSDLRGDDVLKLWAEKNPLWKRIARRIRSAGGEANGGLHEWLMVSSTADLLDIGIGVDEILSLSFRSDVDAKIFRLPQETIEAHPPEQHAAARAFRFSHSENTPDSQRTLALMHRELAAMTDLVRREYLADPDRTSHPERARNRARQSLYDQARDIAEIYLAPEAPWPSGFGPREP